MWNEFFHYCQHRVSVDVPIIPWYPEPHKLGVNIIHRNTKKLCNEMTTQKMSLSIQSYNTSVKRWLRQFLKVYKHWEPLRDICNHVTGHSGRYRYAFDLIERRVNGENIPPELIKETLRWSDESMKNLYALLQEGQMQKIWLLICKVEGGREKKR